MKRALLIGIDNYLNAARLTTCVADATAMSTLLERQMQTEQLTSIVV